MVDWNEPDEAAYLKENIVFELSIDGLLDATWQSGVHKMIPGFTMYAQKTVEARW